MNSGERTVAIHQPNYLPWIGYFHKMYRSDVFVFLDDVEYSARGWINRNRVKTPDGWTWLTVPVTDSTGPIREVEIATQHDWEDEHWRTFRYNYGSAPHFEEWAGFLEDAYDRRWTRLYDLNRHVVEEIYDRLGLECEFVESSTLSTDGTKTRRLVQICEAVDGDRYFSGQGAKDYTDESLFEEAGIELEYQSFDHPTYPQRFDGFVPRLSFLDLLLNVGSEAAMEGLSTL